MKAAPADGYYLFQGSPNEAILAPLAKLAWTIAWNHWANARSRQLVSVVAVAAWLVLVAGALIHEELLATMGRALFALALAAIAIRIALHGEDRLPALAAMLLRPKTEAAGPDVTTTNDEAKNDSKSR